MSKINWEKLSMEMIVEAGMAKTSAIEAINEAKKNNFDNSLKKLEVANEKIGKASMLHFDVIQKEARGEKLDFKVLFMHAEDQLLSTQTIILLASEIVDLYRKINKN